MQNVRLLHKIYEYISDTYWCRVNMVGIRYGRNYASENFKRRARLLHPIEAGQQCRAGGLSTIYDLCTDSKMIPGPRRGIWWSGAGRGKGGRVTLRLM